MLWARILLVAVGGAVGAACRYGVSLAAARWFGTGFPFGTLMVNFAGCFLIGLAFGAQKNPLSAEMGLLFVTGFLGALTTFSSFSAETHLLWQNRGAAFALLNVAANNVGGLAWTFAGMWVGRRG